MIPGALFFALSLSLAQRLFPTAGRLEDRPNASLV